MMTTVMINEGTNKEGRTSSLIIHCTAPSSPSHNQLLLHTTKQATTLLAQVFSSIACTTVALVNDLTPFPIRNQLARALY